MAVYTSIKISDLHDWLKSFNLGKLEDLKGISAGVTNTNYLISTSQSKYILTLFEHSNINELPFYVNLMSFLVKNKFPCPQPILNNKGESLSLLKGKPALIVSFIEGKENLKIDETHCFLIGEYLAKLHNLTKDFSEDKKNTRDFSWIKIKYLELKRYLSSQDRRLIELEIDFLSHNMNEELPSGIIHGDLFRDNVLFFQNKVSGIIDFYYACNEWFIFDIAIVINDWCVSSDGEIDKQKLNEFMKGYQSNRLLHDLEFDFMTKSLRWAALRFWLSRLDDTYNIKDGEITSIKDPNYFRNILIDRQFIKDIF